MVEIHNSGRNRKRKTLREKVYAQIKNAIVEGTLEPNARLIEENLSSEMGSSRTPVREALQKLEKEDLIFRRPKGGFVVKGVTEEEVEEVLGIQCVLEGYAAHLATPKITDDEVAFLKELVRRQEHCVENRDVADFIRLDREFHTAIHQAAKSPLLYSLLQDLRDFLHRYRVIIFRYANIGRSIEDHKKMLGFMTTQKPRQAQKLIGKHLIRGKDLIKKKIRNAGREV